MSSLSSRAQKRRAKHSLLEPLPVVICSSLKHGSEMENLDGSSLYLRIWMGFVIYCFHHTEYWSVSMFRFFVLCDLNCCKVLLNSFFLLGLILHSYEIDSHLFCRSMYHPLNWIFFLTPGLDGGFLTSFVFVCYFARRSAVTVKCLFPR